MVKSRQFGVPAALHALVAGTPKLEWLESPVQAGLFLLVRLLFETGMVN